jgi:hypothetical protein
MSSFCRKIRKRIEGAMQKTTGLYPRLNKILLLFMTSWLIAPVVSIASCTVEETDNGTIRSETVGEAITTITMPDAADSAEEEPAGLSWDGPQYGGTINLALMTEPEFNLLAIDAAIPSFTLMKSCSKVTGRKARRGDTAKN